MTTVTRTNISRDMDIEVDIYAGTVRSMGIFAKHRNVLYIQYHTQTLSIVIYAQVSMHPNRSDVYSNAFCQHLRIKRGLKLGENMVAEV